MAILLTGGYMPVLAQEVPLEEGNTEETLPAIEEVVSTSTPLEEVTPASTPVEQNVLVIETPEEPSVELIVKFNKKEANLNLSPGRQEANAVIEQVDAVLEERLPGANSAVISIGADQNISAVINELENDSSVEYAEPNYPRTFSAINTDDTLRDTLWALENTGQIVSGSSGMAGADIDGVEAWSLSLGTSTVVAVIDNGVLYTHPDLVNNMWNGSSCVSETGAALGSCMHGYDFDDSDLIPLPEATSTSATYHGTHVAGIIAAEMNNATGTIGVAPKAKIMALRFGLDVASEIKAIDFAIQNGAKIINASFGGTQLSQSEYDAIARFRDAGGIFIAAAGNGDGTTGADNEITPTYPASYDLANIVSVAATGQIDEIAPFSNYGTTTVDIGAPGRRIMSTIALNGTDPSYTVQSGTSMAAPHVAGVAALIKSLYPSASTTAIKSALLNSGDSLASLLGKTVTGKRLNALSALEYFAADVTAPVITLIGDASITITAGDSYNDQGATAVDDIDGTYAVVGVGTVDTTTPGVYTITYNTTDVAGNAAAQVERVVSVLAAPTPSRRGGGGGGGGGGSRTKTESVANPARPLLNTLPASSPYSMMTVEQRTALLNVLVQLLTKLQAQLAALQARGL